MNYKSELLFKEIDEQATIDNCKHFLSVNLPRAVLMSGRSITDLQSPSMDGMPKASSYRNSNEDKIVRRMAAQEIVEGVTTAVSHCSVRSRQILDMVYIKRDTDKYCRITLGIDEASYFSTYKPRAILEFADAYLPDDLHVYIDE